MAIKYDKTAPTGWGIDDTGHFTKVPTGYVQQGGYFVAPSSSPANPVPAPVVTPAPAPAAQPNTPAAADYNTYTGQSTPKAAPAGYQTLTFNDQNQQEYQKMADQYDIIATPYSEGGIIKTAYYGKPIQWNYLVNASGNRKKVRLDDSAGMAAAFAAGFSAEAAPGVPTGNTDIKTPSGAIDQSQMKKATLRKVAADGSVSRVVVTVGSQDAQKYFGAGYTLETAAQAPDVAVTMKAPDGKSVVAANKAEAENLMKQGYTPVTVANNTPVTLPASVASRTDNGAMTNVTDINAANNAINAGQEQDQSNYSKKDEPQVRGGTSTDITTPIPTTPAVDLNAVLNSLLNQNNQPKTPSLVDTYGSLKTKEGVTNLETQLNDLTTQQNDVIAQREARIASEKSKPVDLSLAAGRISEVESQENTRLTAIQNQITSIQNQIKQKTDAIDTIMKYTQQDYTNASDAYEKQFSNNIQAINLVRGIQQDQKTDAENAKDNARANLQIYANLASTGALDLTNLTPAKQLELSKLELQAGFPQGFLQTITNKNPKADIVSTTNSEESGKEYISVLKREGDKMWVDKYVVGDAKTTATKPFELSPAEITSIVDKYKDPQQAIDYMRNLYNQSNGMSGDGAIAAVVSALPKITPQGSVWMRGKTQAPECGQFVNDVTGVGVGDSLASKKAIMDSSIKTPQVGDVVVTTDGGTTNGHVAIVTVISGGKITLAESNVKKVNGVGVVTYDRQLSLNDSRILGYAHPKTNGSSSTAANPPELKDTTTGVSEADKKKADIAALDSSMKAIVGGDGHVSNENWKVAKNAWLKQGYDGKQFDTIFADYINPNYADLYDTSS